MGSQILNSELDYKILELYNTGLYPKEIVETLKCDKSKVYRTLKKNMIVPRKRNRSPLTEIEEKEILALYKKNMTIEEIQRYYPNLKVDQINYFLRKKGITRRNGKRIYLNEDYFEEIDTEHKAYFLGLLMADGSLQKAKKSQNSYSYMIILSLNKEDSHVIEVFRQEVETNLKVKHYLRKYDERERWESKLALCSKKMFDDLNKLGKKPMKIETCLYVPDIPDDLVHHFIRGYFDGDGTVYSDSYKESIYPRVTIYGTFDFLCSLKNTMNYAVYSDNIKVHIKKDINVSMLTLGSRATVKNFYYYIYKDATIFMNRRKNKFEKVLFNE